MTFSKYFCSLVFILLLLPRITFAQSVWVNAIPTLYHPSFAGSSGGLRIASNNTFEDNSTKSGNAWDRYYSNSNSISADNFFGKIHTGVSLILNYSDSHENLYYSKGFGGVLAVAPKFSFREKITFSPSIQVSLAQGKSRINETTYNPTDSSTSSTYTVIPSRHLSALTGAMLNSRKFFIGVTYLFYSRSYSPLYAFGNVKFSERFSIISGYTFRKSDESKFSFTPVLLLSPNFSSLNFPFFYLNFKYRKLLFGTDLDLQLMLGYESKKFKIMLVQYYRSQTDNAASYKHYDYIAQLSLRYQFSK